MKNESTIEKGYSGYADPVRYYIPVVICVVFLYITCRSYVKVFYDWILTAVCLMFVGTMLERRTVHKCRENLVLPLAMVVWFLILQIKRHYEDLRTENIGLFISTYLFAFPLASLLREGDKKKALKIFAGGYLSAAAVLSVEGLLLVLNCLPAFLSDGVRWNGSRLEVFWHPNVTACFLMIGTAFCTSFFGQAKSRWSKLGYGILLVMMLGVMALTSCRTAIILTGGYLGALLFFMLIKKGRKWFVPGVLIMLLVTVLLYTGARYLYQTNHEVLIKKYIQQYSEQLVSDHTDADMMEIDTSSEVIAVPDETEAGSETVETEAVIAPEEAEPEQEIFADEEAHEEEEMPADTQEETIPIAIDSETGEVFIIEGSGQGSIESDFGTFNSRTYIWSAARFAIRETPSILYWGMPDPGEYVSYYNFFPIPHLHNAWVECLVGMGLPGFLMAVLFTLITIWNSLRILLRYHKDIWKRNVALLTLCLMVAAFLEPYLFYTTISYHPIDFLFFLCAGYLVYWQEADNRRILAVVRRRLHLLRK